jgi:hypothetical protein
MRSSASVQGLPPTDARMRRGSPHLSCAYPRSRIGRRPAPPNQISRHSHGEPDLARQQAAVGLHDALQPRGGERPPHALGLASGHHRHRRIGAHLLPCPCLFGWYPLDLVAVPHLRGEDLASCWWKRAN